jgi:hypothetical protein
MPARTRSRTPRLGHRPQANGQHVAVEDLRPLVVRPLIQTVDPDRMHNPDDITVDDAAIAEGAEHGGAFLRSVAVLNERGRKRR